MTPSLYLLDTSVCIPILRNRVGVERLPPLAKTKIPAIVAAELWTGVKKNEQAHRHHRKRLEEFLRLFSIVDFDHDSALHYADIRVALEANGTPIGPLDLLIAAQARSRGATLATVNYSEFARVPNLEVLPYR